MTARVAAVTVAVGAVWLLLGRGWAFAAVGALAAIWWLRRVERRARPQRRRVNLARIAGPAHLWQCAYCGRRAESHDHIIPFSKGGSDDPSNLVPACMVCQRSKGADTLADWWQRIGRGAPYPGWWPKV